MVKLMIINNYSEQGLIGNPEFPGIDKDTAVKNKFEDLLADYQREAQVCGDDLQCIQDKFLKSPLAVFLKELFYTRTNKCFIEPTVVEKFKGIMIHSPAAYKSGMKVRDDFDKLQEKNGKKVPKVVDTHFIIDGNTGNIYNLLPLNYKANHCGRAVDKNGYLSFNGEYMAIDIGEPSGLTYHGKKDEIILAEVYSKEIKASGAGNFSRYLKKEAEKKGVKSRDYMNTLIKERQEEYNKVKDKKEAIWKENQLTTEKINSGYNSGYTIHDNRVYEITNYEAVKEGTTKSYEAAVELCAFLCMKFGFNPLQEGYKGKHYEENGVVKYVTLKEQAPNVIISHQEGYIMFHKASNHGDPISIWKVCLRNDLTMDTFRAAVETKKSELERNNIVHPMFDLICQPRFPQ